ncbi:MAG TPA: alternative ribosome rescue aminoacyl-tRNA hydrolase ArfB [Acidimicrobiales bacterium]|jgi:ribosome-associated protein|nr:alternative ribosome rescue aminoacyl-tRNA hydrolase ArfB [Acidimicrobiales bacterium]
MAPDDLPADARVDPDLIGPSEASLRVHKAMTIPMSEITWRATTSGGPGGQHANRTLSRVEVQFDVAASASLGPRQRSRLIERYGPVVRAAASESRSQSRNRQLALERLATRLAEGLRVDPTRRPTRPTKGSQVRRVEAKKRRSETKRQRRAPGADE